MVVRLAYKEQQRTYLMHRLTVYRNETEPWTLEELGGPEVALQPLPGLQPWAKHCGVGRGVLDHADRAALRRM